MYIPGMYDILQGNILSNVHNIHKMLQIQFIINHMLLQVERDIFFMYGSMNKMIIKAYIQAWFSSDAVWRQIG